MTSGTRAAAPGTALAATTLSSTSLVTVSRLAFPGVLGEIVEAAGLDTALKIASAVGGTRVYIMARPPADNWLSRLVGHQAALAIGKAIAPGNGGIDLLIPMGPNHSNAQRWRLMHELIDKGMSKREIARRCGFHERTVQYHRNRLQDLKRVSAQISQLPLL